MKSLLSNGREKLVSGSILLLIRWTRERVWGTGIRWFVKNGSRDDPAASAAAEVKLFLPHEGPERGHARASCGWTQMDAVTK